jgi:hypothetical protein
VIRHTPHVLAHADRTRVEAVHRPADVRYL